MQAFREALKGRRLLMARKPTGMQRRGWPAATCAAAAAKAAYVGLLTGRFPDPVAIRTHGDTVSLALAEKARLRGGALAAITKDMSDLHDIAAGTLIRVAVRRLPAGSGVLFVAGEGVGVVTRPAAEIAFGEPAIDPAARAMIRDALTDVAAAYGDSGDVEVIVSIPGGAELARTQQPDVGLTGGLTIPGDDDPLATWSAAAHVASIQRRIELARRRGAGHVVAVTDIGALMALRFVDDLAAFDVIHLGGFVGGALSYLRRHPVGRLTLAGGCAEMAAVACGRLDPAAERMPADLRDLALLMAEQGVPATVSAAAREAGDDIEIVTMAHNCGLDLGGLIATRASAVIFEQTGRSFPVEVVTFDRSRAVIGRSAMR